MSYVLLGASKETLRPGLPPNTIIRKTEHQDIWELPGADLMSSQECRPVRPWWELFLSGSPLCYPLSG